MCIVFGPCMQVGAHSTTTMCAERSCSAWPLFLEVTTSSFPQVALVPVTAVPAAAWVVAATAHQQGAIPALSPMTPQGTCHGGLAGGQSK